jgi:hypothetical protein
MIRYDTAVGLGMPIQATRNKATQADGVTRIDIRGEIDVILNRGSPTVHLQALVAKDLDSAVLAGMPFLEHNGISIDPPMESEYSTLRGSWQFFELTYSYCYPCS